MFTTLKTSLRMSCAAGALAAASAQILAFESLHASYGRMLADTPAVAWPAAVPAGPADPLLAALVQPLRDGTRPARAGSDDPVTQSFARMLSHEPSRHVPPLPQSAGTDPLIAAVALPLLRKDRTLVAGAGAGTQLQPQLR